MAISSLAPSTRQTFLLLTSLPLLHPGLTEEEGRGGGVTQHLCRWRESLLSPEVGGGGSRGEGSPCMAGTSGARDGVFTS